MDAVHDGSAWHSWAQLQARADAVDGIVRAASGADLVVALLAGIRSDRDIILADPAMPSAEISDVPPGRGLCIFSSGTTGRPRPSWRPWSEFRPGPRWAVGSGTERWGIGYAPTTYAGVRATADALRRCRSLAYVTPGDLCAADQLGFDVVAGTPSFWRMVAIAAARRGGRPRPVEVVSTGGEPVDASLLETIRTTIAPARIVHIFGTTEAGTLLKVDDGRPGLPLSAFGRRLPNGARLRIKDGQLHVSPAPRAEFSPTGDTVRVEADRVHVLGRVGAAINVGGRKVDPVVVSQAVMTHPDVVGARVYAVANNLLGSVVAVDVVTAADQTPAGFIAAVKAHARSVLAPHERPALVRVVHELPMARSTKLSGNG